jgi:hypothetical protein
MQKLFPPVSEAATGRPAPSPDTPAAAPQATDPSPDPAAAAASASTRLFAWPPPEEDLDDWHVFKFGDEASTPAAAPGAPAAASPAGAGSAAGSTAATHSAGTAQMPVRPATAAISPSAPTIALKPSETPTLKIVSPLVDTHLPKTDTEAETDTGDLADTSELTNADATNPAGLQAQAPATGPVAALPRAAASVPAASGASLPASATPAAPPAGMPTTASLAGASPKFTTPATAPIAGPVPATTSTHGVPAPVTKSRVVFPEAPVSSWPPVSGAMKSTGSLASLASLTPSAPVTPHAPTAPISPISDQTIAGFATPPDTSPITNPITAPIAAPITSPITAPIPASLRTASTQTSAPSSAPAAVRSSSAMTSLSLSGALNEPGAALPARRNATTTTAVAGPAGDTPLMSATVEVLARNAPGARTARSAWSWLPRTLVIALALLATGEAAYIGTLVLRTPAVVPPAAVLFVQSQPAGAEILIDGQARGRTPLRVELPPGQHVLELRKDHVVRRFPLVLAAGTQASQYVEMRASDTDLTPPGSASRSPSDAEPAANTGAAAGAVPGQSQGQPSGGSGASASIPPGGLAAATGRGASATTAGAAAGAPGVALAPDAAAKPLRPPATSGWLVIQSPLTLSILRNGEAIGNSDDGRLAIGPGHQELELSNDTAGYREAMTIQILPGQVTTLRPDLPQSTIDIESTPNAKVLIDGREVGETPLTQVALTIGAHDVAFRHPDFADRHVSAFIRVGTPAHVSVDFAAP